jgi:hypothetical protein
MPHAAERLKEQGLRSHGAAIAIAEAPATRRAVSDFRQHRPGFGGQLDFLAAPRGLVRYELIPVEDPIGIPGYAPDQYWAEPDVDHAAALLRELAGDPRCAVEQARDGATPGATNAR